MAENGRRLAEVREFWDEHPLYSGESTEAVGSRAFFEQHERVLFHEFSGSLDRIFTRDIGPESRVLDVGCGIGFWVHQFCRFGADVTGCDLSSTAVQATAARVELFGLDARVVQANAERLPFAKEAFDHVNCYGVIHHTPQTELCVEEFARVLKRGGTVCFAVYYKNLALRSRLLFRTVTALLRPWIGLKGRGREDMLSALTPEELVRMYDGADNPIGKAYSRAELVGMIDERLELLEYKRVGFPRRALPLPLPNRVHRGLSETFGLMAVVRCRKRAD